MFIYITSCKQLIICKSSENTSLVVTEYMFIVLDRYDYGSTEAISPQAQEGCAFRMLRNNALNCHSPWTLKINYTDLK